MEEINMENYWKSEWALLSIAYSGLKQENRNLKQRNTLLHKKYCEMRLKYETLLYKIDLQEKQKKI